MSAFSRLPDDALVNAIHRATGRTTELADKVFRVGQGADDSVVARRVRIGQDQILQTLGRLVTAPNVSVRDEEDLRRAVLFQTGQQVLFSVSSYVILISTESLAQTAVIRNVFALSVDSVHLIEENNENRS